MPIVEPTALFVRGIGEVTDIVEKEMYTFEDRERRIADAAPRERPPASCARRSSTTSLYDGPQRVWTTGPMFRHERPQKGRYRQFHQFDVEALGFAGPDVDAEQIVMLARLWKQLGMPRIELQINSIGDAAGRPRASRQLIAYFERHAELLDDDAKRRLHTNPLRILDSKNPADAGDDRRGAEARRLPRGRLARPLRGAAGAARASRASPTRSTRAWCAASTTTTARCSSGSPTRARRAGDRRRRRPLRRPVRAAGRQAHAGVRLRDRRRAHDPADAGSRSAQPTRASRSRTSCTRATAGGARVARGRERCAMRGHAVVRATPAAAASSRR